MNTYRDIYTDAGLPFWMGHDLECPHCGELIPYATEDTDNGLDGIYGRSWAQASLCSDYWEVHTKRCPHRWTDAEIEALEAEATERANEPREPQEGHTP